MLQVLGWSCWLASSSIIFYSKDKPSSLTARGCTWPWSALLFSAGGIGSLTFICLHNYWTGLSQKCWVQPPRLRTAQLGSYATGKKARIGSRMHCHCCVPQAVRLVQSPLRSPTPSARGAVQLLNQNAGPCLCLPCLVLAKPTATSVKETSLSLGPSQWA